jgi:hypothetical protein
MQEVFGLVLFAVVLVGLIVAVATFLTSGRAYEQIGKGGLSLRDGTDRPADEPVTAAVRDYEIRQMLVARNERRVRRGEEPLDVEAELAQLTRPALDPALAAEVRDLVEARNERRARQGKPPLDVEAEVARRLRELI